MEEELVCDICNGSGSITDSTGHMDVCGNCFGLGYVKEVYRPPPLSDTKRKLKKALVYTFVALSIYYALFSYSFLTYSLTTAEILIILMTGHLAAVSFLVFYILFKAARETTKT